MEEALIEMYLAGVLVRWMEDITEALWNTRVSSSTISDLNQKIYGKIEEWRMRPIHGEHPYIFLDGVYLKCSWGGEVSNVSVLVAVGVNEEGYREILGIAEESREDKESWTNFLRYLKNRGLSGVKLIVSDKCSGLHGIIGDFFPGCEMAALRCPLVSECVHDESMEACKKYRRDAESNSCTGRQGCGTRESKTCHRETAENELE